METNLYSNQRTLGKERETLIASPVPHHSGWDEYVAKKRQVPCSHTSPQPRL
jgi:hypothetical protein